MEFITFTRTGDLIIHSSDEEGDVVTTAGKKVGNALFYILTVNSGTVQVGDHFIALEDPHCRVFDDNDDVVGYWFKMDDGRIACVYML